MTQFDSHKWTREFKEARVDTHLMEKMDTMSNSDIASLQKMISKYDITKIQNVIKILSDRLAESGITETDYSTMRLKSNIAQKWKNADDMYEDMVNWIESVYIANGVEAVEPIEDALELLLKDGITHSMNTDKAQQGYNDRMRSSLDR